MGTLLKHEAKVTKYKLALLGATDAVGLSYPDLRAHRRFVAIPDQDHPPRHSRDLLKQLVRQLEGFVDILHRCAAGTGDRRVHATSWIRTAERA